MSKGRSRSKKSKVLAAPAPGAEGALEGGRGSTEARAGADPDVQAAGAATSAAPTRQDGPTPEGRFMVGSTWWNPARGL